MTLDPDLLARARAAGSGLADADRQALVARAEYHTAIRRLHLAGAPLREIAEALGLSHQRVQQMVTGAGGSWWQRAWRTRRPRRDAVCTWCGRPPTDVAKLVAGPNVYICDRCLGAAERVIAGHPPGGGVLARAASGSRRRCSFCRRRAGEDRPLAVGASANICVECARISRGFMDGPGPPAASTA
jgi:hypothetical protein